MRSTRCPAKGHHASCFEITAVSISYSNAFYAAEHPFESDTQTNEARRQAAKAQHDHSDVPERPPVEPERKVEIVESRVNPPLDSIDSGHAGDDTAHLRINVKPRLVGIAEF